MRILFGALCAVLSLGIVSCGAAGIEGTAVEDARGARPDTLRYSILCMIHGDGDYLYHDTDGRAHRADDDAVQKAEDLARANPEAEAFIFHVKPKTHFLFIFPRADGEFLYYRGGRLLVREAYHRDDERRPAFSAETELYRRYRADDQQRLASILYYCGHEIPEQGGEGYDDSYPDRAVTIDTLAAAIGRFRPDASKFDLVILSTCFGGTPYTIGALGARARFIIASPDYLHLSYFDLAPLEHLERSLRQTGLTAVAEEYARQAFTRLSERVQTVVSVAVYDIERVQPSLRAIRMNDAEITIGKPRPPEAEHCDCADEPSFTGASMHEGVRVFYRAPRFGRSSQKAGHSGWECWKSKQ